MQLKSKNSVFFCESTYEEKNIPKSAGFWWHGGNCYNNCKACKAELPLKIWWTPKEEIAQRLERYADSETKALLTHAIKVQEESKATDNQEVSIPAPAGLEYMPFQRAGIAYAIQRDGTLIGDEMGLGKTIQALGTANYLNSKNILIICPASLRINWKKEAEKWLVSSHTFYVVENNNEIPENATCVITNYDRIKGQVLDSILKREWDLLIVDECHYLKNPKAQRTQRVMGTRDTRGLVSVCKKRLFLTGTPILNRPIELHPIVAHLKPSEFGKFMPFAKRYCNAHHNGYGWDFSGSSNLDELQTRLRAHIMVRRLKKDVLKELPLKIRQIVSLPPNGSTKAVKAEKEAWDRKEETIQALRDDADLAHASGDQEAYKIAVSRLREVAQASFEEISRLRHETALSKVPAVIEHLEGMIENGIEKVVVFAHHRDVIALLSKKFGVSAVTLTGETSMENRNSAVERFQNDPAVKFFIGSIKAAGVGLTLTASSHVVFSELDWVPGNITQAEDRCHRIGQENVVQIQHLVIDESLDAKFAKVLVDKQEVIDKALDITPEIDDTVLTPPRPRKYPEATEKQRESATLCLRTLAGMCDGACKQDGMGFNKPDAKIGHALAQKSLSRDLTDGEVFLAQRILPKYHGQLGSMLDGLKRVA